jgi:hypothetical protein
LRGIGELLGGIAGAAAGGYIGRLIVLETELERQTDVTIVLVGIGGGFVLGAWLVWRSWTSRE